MRAWVLEEFGGPLMLRDVPVPTIAPHEVEAAFEALRQGRSLGRNVLAI